MPLPTGGEVFMFTGEAGGDCYSFYWNQRRGPIARLLVGGLACEPGPASVQSAHHVYHRQTPWTAGHLPGISVAFDWDDVLPDPQRLRPWVVPVLLVLGTAGLYLAVGITRDLLGVEPERKRRAPGPGASEVAV